MVFKNLLKHFSQRDGPHSIAYGQIVAQARQEAFYASGNVADTVDGRYDMIVLHTFLLINRLNVDGSAEAKEFSQNVFNEMFTDMDRSLREMGVGDLAVGKKIKKMAQVFYGRVQAYDEAIKLYGEQPQLLVDVVSRNIFPETEDHRNADKIARYMVSAAELLRQQQLADLLVGVVEFPEVKAFFDDT